MVSYSIDHICPLLALSYLPLEIYEDRRVPVRVSFSRCEVVRTVVLVRLMRTSLTRGWWVIAVRRTGTIITTPHSSVIHQTPGRPASYRTHVGKKLLSSWMTLHQLYPFSILLLQEHFKHLHWNNLPRENVRLSLGSIMEIGRNLTKNIFNERSWTVVTLSGAPISPCRSVWNSIIIEIKKIPLTGSVTGAAWWPDIVYRTSGHWIENQYQTYTTRTLCTPSTISPHLLTSLESIKLKDPCLVLHFAAK